MRIAYYLCEVYVTNMDFSQLIFFFCCVCFIQSAPLDDSKEARILKYDYTNDGTGNYYFEYMTSDGQSRDETGELTSPESEHPEIVVKGSYSFTAMDGVVYTVHYTADKDGFHPEGDHIKVPPYTPWPTNVNLDNNDGQYHPEHDYKPNIKPLLFNDYTQQTVIQKNVVNPKPSPIVKYIPSTPSPKINDPYPGLISHTDSPPTPLVKSVKVLNDIKISDSTPSPTTAYIPSSPSPKIHDPYSVLATHTHSPSNGGPSISSVTVSPINHIAAGSTPVPKIASPRGFRDSKSDLFEVIQNNHSNRGVFKE